MVKVGPAVCFVIALFVNPYVACGGGGSEDEDFTYGEAEMEDAVVGTYTGPIAGTEDTVTLVVERAPAEARSGAGLKAQCGYRTFFVRPAGACASVSEMAVRAALSSEAGTIATLELQGAFRAYYSLTGELELQGEGGEHLSASYTDGAFTGWSYSSAGDTPLSLELVRVP